MAAISDRRQSATRSGRIFCKYFLKVYYTKQGEFPCLHINHLFLMENSKLKTCCARYFGCIPKLRILRKNERDCETKVKEK